MSRSRGKQGLVKDTRGRVGLEYLGVYFAATVVGLVVLTGWGIATCDHAHFTHDVLTTPYGTSSTTGASR